MKKTSINKLNVDTTVQEKAISYPTDANLYHSMREKLVKMSKEHAVKLRQSYKFKSKRSLFMRGRYRHCHQMKQSNKELRHLRTYLGRVVRDTERKVVDNEELHSVFSGSLSLAK